MAKTKSLAVLIDADNANSRYAQGIFGEIAKLGEANVRRIYGDFSKLNLRSWDDEIKSLAIVQRQQPNNTKGKNASDILLVIDAMDLMYREKVNGFCLVSSDSDFTRLAQRLREERMEVWGFGERKTAPTFRSACNHFIYVENLIAEDTPAQKMAAPAAKKDTPAQKKAAPTAKKEPPSKVKPIIIKAMNNCDDDDGWVNLGPVGSWIHKTISDFDPRSYGCPNLKTLVQKAGGFEVRKVGGKDQICRKPAGRKAENKVK